MPAQHHTAGLAQATAIHPLDINGNSNPSGKYVLLSIGMSNTTQEWCNATNTAPPTAWSFMGKAAVSSAVNHSTLAIVNGPDAGFAAWPEASLVIRAEP